MKKLFIIFSFFAFLTCANAKTDSIPQAANIYFTKNLARRAEEARPIFRMIDNRMTKIEATAKGQIEAINAVLPLKVNKTSLSDSMQKVNDNINYGNRIRAEQDSIFNANKLDKSDYVNADWNATSGKGMVLNKPNVNGLTAQWSFLGNALAGNAEAFLGTTDDYTFIIRQNNQPMLKLASPLDINDVEGYSISIGNANSNSDGFANSISMGYGGAGAEESIMLGYNSGTNQKQAVAIGSWVNSSGIGSLAIGNYCESKSVNGIALGFANDISDNPDPISAAQSDRLFQIGAGENSEEGRKNAVTILRNGNVSIGSNYAPTAPLVITSTTGGVIFPRLTTAQRNAISSPIAGTQIFNITVDKMQVRTSTAWVDLH